MSQLKVGGAITVLNAFGTGIGSAIGTAKVHNIILEDSDGLIIDTGDPSVGDELITACINRVSSEYDLDIENIRIKVDSKYPPARGMKTSSAVSCGVIALLSRKYRLGLSDDIIIEISAMSSIDAGVSITGAIDDAYASFVGGFHLTDNNAMRSLYKGRLKDPEKYSVIFLVPRAQTPKSSIKLDISAEEIKVLSNVKELVLKGDWQGAIVQNTSVYAPHLLRNPDIIEELQGQLDGILGLNGAGPSLFLVCSKKRLGRNLSSIKENFDKYRPLVTKIR